AVSFMARGVVVPVWAFQHGWMDQGVALLIAAGAAVVGLFLLINGIKAPAGSPLSPRLLLREPERSQAAPPALLRRKYRNAARRSARRVIAPVSGRATARLLPLCFVASATLVPGTLPLAPWLHAEAALGA